MLDAYRFLPKEREALKAYLQNPYIMDCLTHEGYSEEAIYKQEKEIRISSQEELETDLNQILEMYSLARKQMEASTMLKDVYIVLDEKEYKQLLLRGELASFYKVSNIPPTVPSATERWVCFKIGENVPYIMVEPILGKEYTGVILLPPFCTLEEEKSTPKSAYKVVQVKAPLLKTFSNATLKEYRKKVLQKSKIIMEIFEKIGKEPLSKTEKLIYTNWKRDVITYLKGSMKRIQEMV